MIAELALSLNQSMAEIPPHSFAPTYCYTEQDFTPNVHGSNSGQKVKGAKVSLVWDNFSSSGASWQGLYERCAVKDQSTSWPQPFANLDSFARLNAIERSNSVDINSPNENIFEIRRLTDLSWIKISNILGVDRRTVNNWFQGRPVKEANKVQIYNVLAVLRYIDRGQAELNRVLLDGVVGAGQTGLALLASGKWDLIKSSLSYSEIRDDSQFSAVDSKVSAASLKYNDAADGTEVSGLLALEVRPASIKRDIVRLKGR